MHKLSLISNVYFGSFLLGTGADFEYTQLYTYTEDFS